MIIGVKNFFKGYVDIYLNVVYKWHFPVIDFKLKLFMLKYRLIASCRNVFLCVIKYTFFKTCKYNKLH